MFAVYITCKELEYKILKEILQIQMKKIIQKKNVPKT